VAHEIRLFVGYSLTRFLNHLLDICDKLMTQPELKHHAWRTIRANEAELRDLAIRILAHPELGYHETQASAWLSDALASRGFRITQPFGGLPTAFDARLNANAGPTIAFLAEYDALPNIGHGCGHNLIGTAAVGAAMGVAAVLAQTGGTLRVIGTPAEEFFDQEEGKIKLLRAGAFDGVDIALMLHPYYESRLAGGDLCFVSFDLVFRGRPAHAASDPWNGANALDGLLATFSNVNALRQQVRPDVRIHGIITDGGQAPNIIPERAAARFMVRAANQQTLEQVYARVQECARAGALASGTQLELTHITTVYNSRLNRTLNDLIAQNLAQLNVPLASEPSQSSGSSDFGNVSHALPAASFAIKTHPTGIHWHSHAVAQGAGEEMALQGMMNGACALAGVALDLLSDAELRQRARKDFETR